MNIFPSPRLNGKKHRLPFLYPLFYFEGKKKEINKQIKINQTRIIMSPHWLFYNPIVFCKTVFLSFQHYCGLWSSKCSGLLEMHYCQIPAHTWMNAQIYCTCSLVSARQCHAVLFNFSQTAKLKKCICLEEEYLTVIRWWKFCLHSYYRFLSATASLSN